MSNENAPPGCLTSVLQGSPTRRGNIQFVGFYQFFFEFVGSLGFVLAAFQAN